MTKPKNKTTQPRRNLALEIACVVDGRPRYRIATEAGVVPNLFSAYITGRLTPSEEHQKRIAKTLGSTLNELFPTSSK